MCDKYPVDDLIALPGQRPRLALHPSLFARRDGPGALVTLRRRDPALRNTFRRLSGWESRLLRQVHLHLPPDPRKGGLAPPANAVQTIETWVRDRLLVAAAEGAAGDSRQLDAALALPFPDGESRGESERTDFPVYVSFAPTLECPFHCAYCFVGEKTYPYPSLQFGRIEEILDELRAGNVFRVNLVGGEALLYPDLMRLVAALHSRGMFVGNPISTKMPLGARVLGRLRDAGLEEIQFSLDTLEEDDLREMVRPPQAFGEGYAARLLRSIAAAGSIGLDVVVRITLTRWNSAVLGELLPRVLDVPGVREAVCAPAVVGDIGAPQELAPSMEDLRRADETIRALHATHEGASVRLKWSAPHSALWTQESVNYSFATEELYIQNARCKGNRTTLCILPDGRTTLCLPLHRDYRFVFGNLSRHSVAEVWHRKEALELAFPAREAFADRPCGTCRHFEACARDAGRCFVRILNQRCVDAPLLPDPRCPRWVLLAPPGSEC